MIARLSDVMNYGGNVSVSITYRDDLKNVEFTKIYNIHDVEMLSLSGIAKLADDEIKRNADIEIAVANLKNQIGNIVSTKE